MQPYDLATYRSTSVVAAVLAVFSAAALRTLQTSAQEMVRDTQAAAALRHPSPWGWSDLAPSPATSPWPAVSPRQRARSEHELFLPADSRGRHLIDLFVYGADLTARWGAVWLIGLCTVCILLAAACCTWLFLCCAGISVGVGCSGVALALWRRSEWSQPTHVHSMQHANTAFAAATSRGVRQLCPHHLHLVAARAEVDPRRLAAWSDTWETRTRHASSSETSHCPHCAVTLLHADPGHLEPDPAPAVQAARSSCSSS